MARKVSQADPVLSIDFFVSGFYTYRSQIFAPFKGIGINVVSFHDPVIDGLNFELTDKFEWQRRPGFSIFCPQPLPDGEIINQFYSSRNLNGVVTDFADTTERLLTFDSTAFTPLLTKTTTAQGYIQTVGNRTFYADGAAADLSIWDGVLVAPWGLAAPTVVPTLTGLGFWRANTAFPIGESLLDPNGNVEAVTAVLIPNGAFESPTAADELPLGGSLSVNWQFDPIYGGYAVSQGYRHIQDASSWSFPSPVADLSLPLAVTVGNVVVISLGTFTDNVIPDIVSITDNLGNTYTVYATSVASSTTGGSTSYKTAWVATAPVTFGGVCTVTATVANAPGLMVLGHEFSGITDTPSTVATAAATNSPSPFNTGTANFSGTQLVLSVFKQAGPATASVPAGYMLGAQIGGSENLNDAYSGQNTIASPSWSFAAGFNLDAGITLAFPITAMAAGYTPYLFLYDFLAAIPLTAVIVGIQVNIPKFNASGVGVVQDQSVRLVIGGAVAGSDLASVNNWSNSGFDSTVVYGGPTELWGLTPTPAQINATGLAGFGVAISASLADITAGSVVPEVGFNAPQSPTITIYYQNANGTGGLGVSGATEPIWATTLSGSVNDGGVQWTNYGPSLTWQPATGYLTPVVVLDTNGNLQLSTFVANPVATWNSGTSYPVGTVVYFGGAYWISLDAVNTTVAPSAIAVTLTGGVTTPYWAWTSTPLVTGTIAPVWSPTPGGATTDGSYTWTNIGQGGTIAIVGHAYVYAYRTIYGHLTTASPFSQNTGAILGPLNASVSAFQITSNIATFTGNNNFLPGNIFQVQGLSIGFYLNNQTFTVISASPSATFPLTSVEVDGANTVIVQAVNNLSAGQVVTFSGVGTATFLNGFALTVLAGGLSSTQFECTFAHGAYGPTADTGNVSVAGTYTASFVHANTAVTADSGGAKPLLATVEGAGTGSMLCNSVAAITAVQVSANIVKIFASNNFQPGLWVTLTGLTNAAFLNTQQVQVIAVDKPLGTQNTWFQVFFETPNYALTVDTGTATFNAVEVYRTSDGGGQYLFTGAVTNPGDNLPWTFNDFTVDDDLDVLLVAALAHQNDPPPGTFGSTVQSVGTILTYWQNRLWMVVGNFVYFDAGPDCTNGLSQEAWPPGNRFQFSGPVFGLEPTPDGVGLLVYLADRVNAILGGPETISFYPTDFLSKFGITNPNALFRDGSTLGQFTTQRQYIELQGAGKDDIGERIADYLAANFQAEKVSVTLHRNGLDVGTLLSNGVDRIVRFGLNPHAWSVPYFPSFGAGVVRSIETSVGIYSALIATPTGGRTAALGPLNPTLGENIIGLGIPWVNPENITDPSGTIYATVTMTGGTADLSQILRSSDYLVDWLVPRTAVVQGVMVTLVGKQDDISGATMVTITPTNAGAGATSHTFLFGVTDSTVSFGSASDTWGMSSWQQPYLVNDRTTLSFDIQVRNSVAATTKVSIAKVQVTVTYQDPGNYIYVRDLDAWGDCGILGQNTGTPYAEANVVIGSITLAPPGAHLVALSHIVGYFDAAGTLNNGGPSQPDVWILPNEVAPGTEVNFIQLPEVLSEPPIGQNKPSSTILALRWNLSMMNSNTASQWVSHLQVKLQFEPENAPNTIKKLAFCEGTNL